jgi:hypothetical protein
MWLMKSKMAKVWLLVVCVLTTGLNTLAKDGPANPQVVAKSAPALQAKDGAELGLRQYRHDDSDLGP